MLFNLCFLFKLKNIFKLKKLFKLKNIFKLKNYFRRVGWFFAKLKETNSKWRKFTGKKETQWIADQWEPHKLDYDDFEGAEIPSYYQEEEKRQQMKKLHKSQKSTSSKPTPPKKIHAAISAKPHHAQTSKSTKSTINKDELEKRFVLKKIISFCVYK